MLTRGTVVIDVDRCKGCELCIPACPPGVLVMSTTANAIGYRYPELLAGCTACQACHAVCPDYRLRGATSTTSRSSIPSTTSRDPAP